MSQSAFYPLLANAVLILHALFVAFVVGGLLAVLAGGFLGWPWVVNLRFRLLHLGAIAYVVLESWLGIACPLTTLESWLRGLGGGAGYKGDFIAYWLDRMLFFQAPSWVFAVCYTLFGLLVAFAWRYFPPRRSSRRAGGE